MDFKDLHVHIIAWRSERSFFEIKACRPLTVANFVPLPLTGAYLFQDGFVTAGVAILRDELYPVR